VIAWATSPTETATKAMDALVRRSLRQTGSRNSAAGTSETTRDPISSAVGRSCAWTRVTTTPATTSAPTTAVSAQRVALDHGTAARPTTAATPRPAKARTIVAW